MSRRIAIRLLLTGVFLALTVEMALRGNAWGAALCGIAAGGNAMMLRRD